MKNVKNENPDLYMLMNRIISMRLASLNTVMPAIIDKFDAENKTCDVTPVFKKKYINEDNALQLPVIQNVPIVFPQTSNSIISLPMKRGDSVLLVFSQRSLEDWKTKGGILEPADKRKHNINDAIAIPGVFPIGQGLKADNSAIKVQNGDLTVLVYEDGKIEIKNTAGELVSILSDLCEETKNLATEIANITTLVMGAPVPPSNVAQLTLYIAKFNAVLTKLNTFKK
ncbi:MAG: hypothetical protein GY817_01160 [bacterium]|nr:hypothetical protein [bacterium]